MKIIKYLNMIFLKYFKLKVKKKDSRIFIFGKPKNRF